MTNEREAWKRCGDIFGTLNPKFESENHFSSSYVARLAIFGSVTNMP